MDNVASGLVESKPPNLQIFDFQGSRVRIVIKDGEPWFVATDVASTLGYSKPHDAISRHCKGVRETRVPSAGGEQTVNIIREGDVFRLILRSKLPSAQEFERMVMEEILPQIRKTGSYGTPAPDPTNLSRLQILTMAIEAEKKVQELACKVEELEPKASALDRIATSEDAYCLINAAKVLQIQPKKLRDWLHANAWIYRRISGEWTGYQDRIKAGFLEHKLIRFEHSDGQPGTRDQVRITAKGMARLATIFAGGMA